MSEYRQFKATEEKLDKLLEENGMVGDFRAGGYPIYLSVSMNRDPDDQMELFDPDPDADDTSAMDASLKFIFQDGDILVRTDSRLMVTDDLLNKIKGHAKKMHYLFLQHYFRQSAPIRPVVADERVDDEEDGQE